MNIKKNIGYFVIVGICSLGLRYYFHPTIPQIISLVAGAVIAVIALVILRLENKGVAEDSFFYSYATNWNGAGILNGAFLLGISLFFFACTVVYGVVFLVAGAVIVYVISIAK